MDLYAYAQISDLDAVAKKNGIDVPRLRGYRLMRDEEVSYPDLDDVAYYCCEELCEAEPFWSTNPTCWTISDMSDFYKDYYCPNKSVRWDRIHGKKRRILKFEIKKQKNRIKKQFDTFNKYVGRDDVLYIHARIGGGNWPTYRDQVIYQPWFIEKVDDCDDSTYCDIYAKIDPNLS